MSVPYDVDNINYTKPSRSYGVLGVNYNTLIADPLKGNPWPSMEQQYVAFPNAPSSYFSLTKDNSGQPYSTINSGYPGACSFYNVVHCPSNDVQMRFPEDPNINNGCGSRMMRHHDIKGTPKPTHGGGVDAQLVQFMNYNHFLLFSDFNTAQAVLDVFPHHVRSLIEIRDPSSSQNEMMSRQIASIPTLVSSATGKSLTGVPSDFSSVYSFFQQDAIPMTSSPTTSSPVMASMSGGDPTFVSVVSPTCPYCIALMNDVKKSPMKDSFLFVDASDTNGVANALGSSDQPAGYPHTKNRKTGKSVTGYNAGAGLHSLVSRLH